MHAVLSHAEHQRTQSENAEQHFKSARVRHVLVVGVANATENRDMAVRVASAVALGLDAPAVLASLSEWL